MQKGAVDCHTSWQFQRLLFFSSQPPYLPASWDAQVT